MILGIGIDTIEIDRFASALKRQGFRFLKRLFTERELRNCSDNLSQHEITRFAARFSAKEAITKALGTGFRGIDWHDIEIFNNDLGKPEVFLSEKLKARFDTPHLVLSISHSKTQVVAFCLWQKITSFSEDDHLRSL